MQRQSPKATVLLAVAALSLASAVSTRAQPEPHYAERSAVLAGPAAYSQQDLDRLLAPIALYPDTLLAQILMAATHPQALAEAARWSLGHPGWNANAALEATAGLDWDASVKSLLGLPQLLVLMDQRPDWTRALAWAFLHQEPHVLQTVQSLRHRAHETGNLPPELGVTQSGSDILIGSSTPERMLLPWYDPLVIYGTWWWPLGPVRWPAWTALARPVLSSGFVISQTVALPHAHHLPHASPLDHGRVDWRQRRVNVVRTHWIDDQPAYRSLTHWRQLASRASASHAGPVTNVAAARPASSTSGMVSPPRQPMYSGVTTNPTQSRATTAITPYRHAAPPAGPHGMGISSDHGATRDGWSGRHGSPARSDGMRHAADRSRTGSHTAMSPEGGNAIVAAPPHRAIIASGPALTVPPASARGQPDRSVHHSHPRQLQVPGPGSPGSGASSATTTPAPASLLQRRGLMQR